jgi:hypothetical protein
MGIGALSRTSDLAGINPCVGNMAVPSKPFNYLVKQIQARPSREIDEYAHKKQMIFQCYLYGATLPDGMRVILRVCFECSTLRVFERKLQPAYLKMLT